MRQADTIQALQGHPHELQARRGSHAQVLKVLRERLGEANVQDDSGTRLHWARTTLSAGTVPRAIVRPASTEEVRFVVQTAARFGLRIHPVSSGRNWGYGDACAVTGGQVVLDLGRMDRILEVNEKLAYVTVEPGVTQGRIADHLEANHLNLWMDATGAGPETSLIGNTLERGFGHTPHGDRFAHACGLEVVLPDGRLLRTGFGHYANAQAAQVYPYGIGPYLDGLFTQSNLGIVTQMTFWLLPKPEAFRAFFFFVEREEQIGPLIEALRPLRLRGTLRTPIHIGNDLRMLSMDQGYPWEAMSGRTPLSPDVRAALRRRRGIQAWTGSGALYGSKAEVSAAAREVRKALLRVPGMRWPFFVDDRRMAWIEAGQRLLERVGLGRCLAPVTGKLRMAYDLLKGKPPATCVRGGLWRVRQGPGNRKPTDPGLTLGDPRDQDGGFFWVSPVLPMTEAHLRRVNALAEGTLNRHGFDYLVTITLINPRALCAIITIAFDKRDPQEALQARRCQDELLERLLKAGYAPYRGGNLSMAQLDRTSNVFFEVAAEIKRALDPRGLLSPGHYEPVRARGGPYG